jgi:hypothetical protein
MAVGVERSGAVLGGDPGEIGAAVVLDGVHVREVLEWDTEDDIGPLVFELCRRWGVTRAAVEWSAKTRGKNERMPPAARVTFGRRAQMLATGAACAGASVRFVAPLDWRADVLRLSGSTSGEDAKRAAIAACWGGGVVRRLSVDLGLVWPALVERSSHVAEAACVAVWARGV